MAFLVQDLCLSFAQSLEDLIIVKLKIWAGLYRSAEVGTLYRHREHLGLQLTSITSHFMHLQLVRSCLLANSHDPLIQKIFSRKSEHISSFAHRWSGPKALSTLAPIASHNIRFAGQTDHTGLGSMRSSYLSNPTAADLRAKISETHEQLQEEKRMHHASCLVQQGVWTHWNDVRPFDLSWRNLIYGPGPRVVAFVLNAQINSVRTPDMLKLWKKIESAECRLCFHQQCTLHHLLVNCKFALNQGRYTWRHDSVLANIEPTLTRLVEEFNSKKPLSRNESVQKSFRSCFVRAGQKPLSSKHKTNLKHGLLEVANDWALLSDYDNKKTIFPPAIFPTNERPDIVLWSRMSRNVILIELTCCAEEGIKAAEFRKQCRYFDLLNSINSSKTWTATLLTIEVGARGLVAGSTFRAFVKIGFPSREANVLCKTLSSVVARCSYAIYLAHNSQEWSHNSDLVLALALEPLS